MDLDIHGSHSRASKEIVLDEQFVNLVSSIKKKMANVTESGRICKVPERFYLENERKYFPQVVSIGPYHHGNEKLKATEERKWQYFNTLLSRAINVETRLQKCVEVLKQGEDRARNCYGEEIHMNSDEFVEMMLIDGCFVIELFYKSCCKGIRRRGDPYLGTYHVFSQLRRDLILLENQIPFFVLQHLFNLTPTPKQCGDYSLVELSFRFFKKTVPDDLHNVQDKYGQEIHHLLDLVHQSFIPKTHIFQPQLELRSQNMPTATQLDKRGTEIKKSNSRSVLEVKFNNGILIIPALTHHDLMEIGLRNLVAMENCCYDAMKYISSYVFLMKRLIHTIDDAKILRKKGIIDKDEEFVTLFSKIPVDVEAKDFYYGDLCEELSNFTKVGQSIWYARKVRNCVTKFLREL
ncbi:UPF0481 protein At3g47200-like [Rutidosis leptorrhynchoides]|uniref:UPF0481 protein At3g47200-like n=1 Tax=Rutidosis leptorrhynchoides TaxID=125765 RepID=UPI003A991CEF